MMKLINNHLCDKCDCKGYSDDAGDGECCNCGHPHYAHFWLTKPSKPDPKAMENFKSELFKLIPELKNITDEDIERMIEDDYEYGDIDYDQ